MGTNRTGNRAVSRSSSETSGAVLSLEDYLQRLKAVGLKVRVKRSALENDWILAEHNSGFKAQVRYFEEPSKFGIDGGRISKLWIADENDKPVVEYDRGWSNKPPKSGPARELYDFLVSLAREPGEGRKQK